MAGRERTKRKALHRGLDDIINRDASLTSRLLGRVQPASREPLPMPGDDASQDAWKDSTRLPAAAGEEGSSGKARTISPSSNSSSSKGTNSLGLPGSPTKPDDQTNVAARRNAKEPLRVVADSISELHQANSKIQTDRQRQSPLTTTEGAAVISLGEFLARWGMILRSGSRIGKLRICEVIYENTYAIGGETFFTSYEKLAKLAGIEKKQCSVNIKQLESLGFVERLNIFNTATKQGTEFKLHLNPLPPNERRAPRYHCYDEDLL